MAKIDDIGEDVKDLKTAVLGENGLLVRFAKLEVRMEQRGLDYRTIGAATALVSAIGTTVAGVIAAVYGIRGQHSEPVPVHVEEQAQHAPASTVEPLR